MTTLQAIALAILGLVALMVCALWSTRPGAIKRAARRSIRLGFPLALGLALAPPVPTLKPCPWGCPPILINAGQVSDEHGRALDVCRDDVCRRIVECWFLAADRQTCPRQTVPPAGAKD